MCSAQREREQSDARDESGRTANPHVPECTTNQLVATPQEFVTLVGVTLPLDALLTVDEVAQRIRATPETIRAWLRTGKLKGAKFTVRGRVGWRIYASHLQSFIDDRMTREAR